MIDKIYSSKNWRKIFYDGESVRALTENLHYEKDKTK